MSFNKMKEFHVLLFTYLAMFLALSVEFFAKSITTATLSAYFNARKCGYFESNNKQHEYCAF